MDQIQYKLNIMQENYKNKQFQKMSQIDCYSRNDIKRLQNLLSCDLSSNKTDRTPEKINFPLITNRLKKTILTKYHSAFISEKYCQNDPTILNKIKLHKQQNINENMKHSARQYIGHEETNHKTKIGLNEKMWKVNKKHAKSIFISTTPINEKDKINKSVTQKRSETGQSVNRINKVKFNQINQKNIDVKNPQIINFLPKFNSIQTTSEDNSRVSLIKSQRNKQIISTINQSQKMIELIKSNFHKGFFNSIDSQSNKQKSLEKLQQKLGLFSYLKRNFVVNGDHLTDDRIKDYFRNKSPSSQRLETKLSLESRIFLKQKIKKDYHTYRQIQNIKKDISSRTIKQEIQQKKKYFHEEYNKKQSSAYMSFLSLPKDLKAKILQNITKSPDTKRK